VHVAYARLQATAYRARLTQGRYIWSYLYDKYVCMFVSLSHCLSLIAYVPYTRPWAAPLSGAVQSNVYSRRINKQIRCPCACRRTMYVKQLPWECVSRLSQLFFYCASPHAWYWYGMSSFCPSVCLSDSGIVPKRLHASRKIFRYPVWRDIILVF